MLFRSSLAIFTEDRRLIGYASYDPSDTDGAVYKLTVQPGSLEIPRNVVTKIYVRPQLLTRDQGGLGGESLQIMSIVVRGNGVWSSAAYVKQSYGTYLPFLIARGRIADVRTLSDERGTLLLGEAQELARFRFLAERGDPGASITIRSLTFSVGRSGDVMIDHPVLRVLGSSQVFSCAFISSALLRCDGLNIALSSMDEGQTVVELDADLRGSSGQRQSVQLSLNDRGTPDRDGGIIWSDGTSTFGWVPLNDPASTNVILSR